MPSPDPANPADSVLSVLNTTLPLSAFHWRLLWQRLLVGAALLCFAASLPAPAVRLDLGAWNNPGQRPYRGWECLMIAAVFYPSNALLALSPVVVFLLKRNRKALPQLVLAGAFTVSTALAVGVGPGMRDRSVGYYLWVIAHALGTLALWIPVWLRRPAEAVRGDGRDDERRSSE